MARYCVNFDDYERLFVHELVSLITSSQYTHIGMLRELILDFLKEKRSFPHILDQFHGYINEVKSVIDHTVVYDKINAEWKLRLSDLLRKLLR